MNNDLTTEELVTGMYWFIILGMPVFVAVLVWG